MILVVSLRFVYFTEESRSAMEIEEEYCLPLYGSLRHIKLSFLFVVMHGKVYMRHKKKAQAPSAVPDGEQLANKSG